MKMRRFLVCALVIMTLLVPLSAFAAEGTTRYELDDIGMSVSITNDYAIFTHDTDPNDPNLELIGLSKEDMTLLLEESGCCLLALHNALSYTIGIVISEADEEGFSNYSDSELQELLDAQDALYSAGGYEILSSSVYKHSQTTFLQTYICNSNGDGRYHLNYLGCYNGQYINIGQSSFVGQIPDSEKLKLRNVIDSISFDSAPAGDSTGMYDSGGFSVPMIILSIILTITIYSVPIIIYRFAVIKAPLEKKKARTITIVYGICAFLVMSVLLTLAGDGVAGSSPIVLWSYVNYRVLIGGKDRRVSSDLDMHMYQRERERGELNSNPVYESPYPPSTEARDNPKYCRRCGSPLQTESVFCNACGTRIHSDDTDEMAQGEN